mmetsp:Transcript_7325/g.21650  ORF Transcript_7325/g.21650 Transcript_7325/m.21650 type:complete len:90 (-) Transcript_7325:10-279(-)
MPPKRDLAPRQTTPSRLTGREVLKMEGGRLFVFGGELIWQAGWCDTAAPNRTVATDQVHPDGKATPHTHAPLMHVTKRACVRGVCVCLQ